MSQNDHDRKSTMLTISSAAVWALFLGANLGAQFAFVWALPIIWIGQGLWIYRFYAIAHEASHFKLYPDKPRLNDVVGSLAMAWVWAPLTIFRQIHNFHHGANRRAPGIATLDTFIVTSKARGWLCYFQWYLMVFAGGFFFHTLASIILFLVLPVRLGKRLSPAFNNWTQRKRLLSWLEFLVGINLHVVVLVIGGTGTWACLLGMPIVVFAVVWSAMLYIYHYQTTIGKRVQFNVRSLPDTPLFSWLLLNFNHHSAHHFNPDIPWYDLPRQPNPQPDAIRMQNDTIVSLKNAVLQQLKGPHLIRDEATSE